MTELAVSRPRLVIAGTAGDSGKSLVSIGLVAGLRQLGFEPRAFKKGPDYIDAAWLTAAAGHPCRNLDTFLQPAEAILATLSQHGSARVNVVEGNRGLFDGSDPAGTHSTAVLAKLLAAPVVLVLGVAKVTRTAAAVALGCKLFDPELNLVGVVLNRVAGSRHEALVRRAVEEQSGLAVLGAVPRLAGTPLPDRHLGLVPPQERDGVERVHDELGAVMRKHVDLGRLVELAQAAPPLPAFTAPSLVRTQEVASPVRIGVFSDAAFTFYYPENLEALERGGAELSFISGLDAERLPAVDGLYLGGGFPETHADRLAKNTALLAELRQAAAGGLPIYAECGGLIYLSQALLARGARFPMAGVLNVTTRLHEQPQGHGYVELEVDRDNPFFARGTKLRGHEFHYTRIDDDDPASRCGNTALRVTRGQGVGGGRDGLVENNVFATYTHLHASGAPLWASGLIQAALRHRDRRTGTA